MPWNGPYYERLGLRALTPEEITPCLAAILADEGAHGIDLSARLVMRRPVTPPDPGSGPRPDRVPPTPDALVEDLPDAARPRSSPARGAARIRPLS